MKICLMSLLAAAGWVQAAPSYTIVFSAATLAKPEWERVVVALEAKHPGAKRLGWEGKVGEVLPELAKQHPQYVCFVGPPTEISLEFVRSVHRLTRKLDADPYTDCRWGILTGFDAANALAIAGNNQPLIIHHTLASTEIAVERCESAQWFCELKAGKKVSKGADGKVTEAKGPADSSADIATVLEQPQTGLFITSGHASQRDWQIGYTYPNGHWTSSQGKLSSVDLTGKKRAIQSPHPKVYLAVGNCLIGHINGPDAMALAYFNSVGVQQMAGYTLPSWYGYQGWGLLDYFLEQPGRFTLTDAYFANQLALVNRLETYFPEVAREDSDSPMGRIAKPISLSPAAKAAKLTPQDANGLLFDRDVVAFYGDPAWEARMAPGKLQWRQTWHQDATGASLEITPLAGAKTFAPVNINGSQRGGRPIIQFFDQAIDPASVVITAGAEFKPVIADDFILIPLPAAGEEPAAMKISFSAKLR